MPTLYGIEMPCHGSLKEIHAALIEDMNALGDQVTINGHGFTVTADGFRDNQNHNEHAPDDEGFKFMHPGVAVLIGIAESLCLDDVEYYEIVTMGKVPHVSERCQLCGQQLTHEEIPKQACTSCYAQEVGH